MKLHLNTVTPTGRDIVRSSIFALGLVAAGNMYQLINYYIFQPAARPAPQSTHDLIIAVMARIDAYQPSKTILNVLILGICRYRRHGDHARACSCLTAYFLPTSSQFPLLPP